MVRIRRSLAMALPRHWQYRGAAGQTESSVVIIPLVNPLRGAVIGSFSGVCLLQRRAFVHGDVVGLVALDFILRIIRRRVVRISLVIRIFRMNLDDLAADMTGLRVPGHVIPDLEFLCHDGTPPVTLLSTRIDVSRSSVTLRWRPSRTRLPRAGPLGRGGRWLRPASCHHSDM